MPSLVGCLPVAGDTFQLSLGFAFVLAGELVIMLLTGYIGYTKYKHSKSPFVAIFYQDGLIYFVLMAGECGYSILYALPDLSPAMSIGNILCNFLAPVRLLRIQVKPWSWLTSLCSFFRLRTATCSHRKHKSVLHTHSLSLTSPL